MEVKLRSAALSAMRAQAAGMRALVAGATVMLWAGCFHHPNLDIESLPCAGDENCPVGSTCDLQKGLCHKSGAAGLDSGPGDTVLSSRADGAAHLDVVVAADVALGEAGPAGSDRSDAWNGDVIFGGASDTPTDAPIPDRPLGAGDTGEPDTPITGTGGAGGSGGTIASSDATTSGGITGSGGLTGPGGIAGTGGVIGGGGAAGAGGIIASGGATTSGGITGSGGLVGSGGATGGTVGTGGIVATGGLVGTGGTGGTSATGGVSGGTGGSTLVTCSPPCNADSDCVDGSCVPRLPGMSCTTTQDCPSSTTCCDGSDKSCDGTRVPTGDGTNSGQFQVSADGLTVADTITGLVWQRDGSGTRAGCTTDSSNLRCTWAEAMDYCAGLTLGGFSDWRLPTAMELSTIVDLTRFSPQIDLTVFPNSPGGAFWTSSPVGPSNTYAWSVDFTGSTQVNDSQAVEIPCRVRCVR